MGQAELNDWMAQHVAGFQGPMTLHRLAGGQSNPTWRVDTPNHSYVLRQKPMGVVLPSAHAVDREYQVMKALAGTDVPVPGVYALCEDPAVMGSMFFVMDYIEGRVFYDPRMPDQTPEERAAIFDDMNRAIAAISTVDPMAVGLEGYGRHGGYVARQVSRWSKQYRASQTRQIGAMEALIDWLPQNLPKGDEEVRVVHGDFRLDNLLIHPTEPKVLAVIDWELGTLGCPLSDFAYNVMTWRVSPDLFRGLAGHITPGSGIPTEDQYIADWCRRTGRDKPANFDLYVIVNLFRMAAILQGIAKRAEEGTASDPDARAVGARAEPMAEIAWKMVRNL